jgi:hypothetical protein
MSLLKALKNSTKPRDMDALKAEFIKHIEALGDKIAVEDLLVLSRLYGEYGAAYMAQVAATLDEPVTASTTMKFMNSYIAEVCKAANVHYFNKEFGYSLVDKVVQDALDNGGFTTPEKVMEFIAEIELSYAEPEEDTEEE